MASAERRRQLVGLGLKALTERPIHEVSLDDITAEAGISRGLLFHYFPTKTAFYEEVVAAAGRRVARTVRPDAELAGEAALDQFLERWIAQIVRRRELYLALVRGNLADLGGQEVAGSLREQMTAFVLDALRSTSGRQSSRLDADLAPLVHAWLAYVEDLVPASTGTDAGGSNALPADRVEALVRHCHAALEALVALGPPSITPRSARPTPLNP